MWGGSNFMLRVEYMYHTRDAVASSSVGLVVWGWGAVKERGGLCPQYFCPPTSQVRVASKWRVHQPLVYRPWETYPPGSTSSALLKLAWHVGIAKLTSTRNYYCLVERVEESESGSVGCQ